MKITHAFEHLGGVVDWCGVSGVHAAVRKTNDLFLDEEAPRLMTSTSTSSSKKNIMKRKEQYMPSLIEIVHTCSVLLKQCIEGKISYVFQFLDLAFFFVTVCAGPTYDQTPDARRKTRIVNANPNAYLVVFKILF